MAVFRQPHDGQGFRDGCRIDFPVDLRQHAQVLFGGPVGHEARRVDQGAGARRKIRVAADALAEHADLAVGWLHQPANNAQQHALAGAVRPADAGDAALRNGEVDVLEDCVAAKYFPDCVEFNG